MSGNRNYLIENRKLIRCRGLCETVLVPDDVQCIGANAFFQSAVKVIRLGEGVRFIEDEAFAGCPYLTELFIAAPIPFRPLWLGLPFLISRRLCLCLPHTAFTELPSYLRGPALGGFAIMEERHIPLSPHVRQSYLIALTDLPKTVPLQDLPLLSCMALARLLFRLGLVPAENAEDLLNGSRENPGSQDPEVVAYVRHELAQLKQAPATQKPAAHTRRIFTGSFLWEYQPVPGHGCAITQYLGEEEDVTVPSHMGTMSVRALRGDVFLCGKHYRITLPDTVTDLDTALIDGDTVTEICVSPENPVFETDEKGGLYNRIRKELVFVPRDFRGSYEIAAGSLSIGDRACAGCKSLKKVVLPPSVTSVGTNAFLGCEGLTELLLPDSLQKIGTGAFEKCTALQELSIPGNVKRIPPELCAGCVSLRKVTLGVGTDRLCRGAFRDCATLTCLDLPFTLVRSERGAAEGCPAIISEIIQKRLEGA